MLAIYLMLGGAALVAFLLLRDDTRAQAERAQRAWEAKRRKREGF